MQGRRRRWLRRSAIGAAAVSAVALVLSWSPGWLYSRRMSTPRERTLIYLAHHTGEAALCEPISWAAYQRYSIIFGGGSASYDRSDCYQMVALARGDASACWRVRPLVDFEWWAAGHSALACRRGVRAQNHIAPSIDEPLVPLFERLGYDIDTLHTEGVITPAIPPIDVYRGLTGNSAALASARERLTASPSDLAAGDRGYLAHIVAIGTGEPVWCEQIPRDVRLEEEKESFRDWCYYTLASNRRDERICEALTPARLDPKTVDAVAQGMRPAIAEQLSFHSRCVAAAHPVPADSPSRYGPLELRDPAQLVRLLASIDVAVPSARSWSESEQQSYVQDFLFALAPDKQDAVTAAARQKLVQRVLALAGL